MPRIAGFGRRADNANYELHLGCQRQCVGQKVDEGRPVIAYDPSENMTISVEDISTDVGRAKCGEPHWAKWKLKLAASQTWLSK